MVGNPDPFSNAKLPPFPDELIDQPDKEKAIVFLLASLVPSFAAADHLRRWGRYVNVEITGADFRRVMRRSRPGVV